MPAEHDSGCSSGTGIGVTATSVDAGRCVGNGVPVTTCVTNGSCVGIRVVRGPWVPVFDPVLLGRGSALLRGINSVGVGVGVGTRVGVFVTSGVPVGSM